jgi:hypothetical protein
MPTTQAGQCQTKLGVVHGFEHRFECSRTTRGFLFLPKPWGSK